MRTRFYGHPGDSALRLATRRRRRRLRLWVFVATSSALLLLGGWPLPAIALIIVAFRLSRRLVDQEARAHAGADGEALVAAHLPRVRAEAVLFDVPLGRGDADVIVLGPMAAVVEVKRASGRVRTHRDGSLTVGGSTLPGRPLTQAIGAAAAAARLIGPAVWVEPIVCVTGMAGRPRTWHRDGQEVVLCSPRQLRRTLRRLPRPLERGLGRDLAQDLAIQIDPSHRARRRV